MSIRNALKVNETGAVAFPRYASTPIIVCEGDSLSSDQSGSGLTTWPFILAAAMPTWDVRSVAIGGQVTSTSVVDCPINAFPFFAPGRAANVFIVMMGTNDLAAGTSATTILSNLETLAQAAAAAGALVAVVTVIPNGTHTGPQQTQRLALNSALIANAIGYFDAVINPCALTQFDAQADTANTTYYNADTIHLTQTGQNLLESSIASGIAGLLTQDTAGAKVAEAGVNSNITSLVGLTGPLAMGNSSALQWFDCRIFRDSGSFLRLSTNGMGIGVGNSYSGFDLGQIRIQGVDCIFNIGSGIQARFNGCRIDAAGQLSWNGRSRIKSTADGSFSFRDNADSADSDISAGRGIFSAPVRLKGYTVATLPAGTVGDTAYVTDALAPTFLATIVGGGAIVAPVFYNGSNWVGH